ncbi:ATP-binding protein [Alteromonas sp. C1M14]|uniref:sensor histidine kinase n=1 Tax=Alteromonas sp. C1M14 TaxID=2841567 RepID=UPI001C08810B|nr:ATP-binding protein [Alteromonas sp. C1M14]MBU2978274.1 GHKL domain-containing protein [Alteromonas sp. C1M14]
MRFSIKAKTILGVALIEATLLAILLFTTYQLLSDLINDAVVKRASTTANLFYSTTKNAFLSYDLASLEADVQELMNNPDIEYVRIADINGRVYAEAGNQTALSRPFSSDSSVNLATDGIYDVRRNIDVDNTLYGNVDLGINISTVKSSLNDIRQWAIGIAIAEMALVALFSFALGSYLTGKLNSLRSGVRRLIRSSRQKQYEAIEIQVKGNDELSELALAFNELASYLRVEHTHRKNAESALQKLNQSLESRIEERTAMINAANDELVKINDELKETQVQLLQAEKMASVGQLAAGVAHEINNPIGFVTSNIATLKDYTATYRMLFYEFESVLNHHESKDFEQRRSKLFSSSAYETMTFINEDLEHVLEESQEGLSRVEEIVRGLKLFSRADSDEKQLFNLNDCVKTTLAMVNNKLKYSCEVVTQLSPLPKTYFNVGRISQIITNLLINAGQAIEATGKVGTITISTQETQGYVELVVEDTGCGIPQNNRNKVFNPFFTTKAEEEGTGLGLSISYGIAHEHGGKLTFDSEEDKGTKFLLSLPIIQENNNEVS